MQNYKAEFEYDNFKFNNDPMNNEPLKDDIPPVLLWTKLVQHLNHLGDFNLKDQLQLLKKLKEYILISAKTSEKLNAMIFLTEIIDDDCCPFFPYQILFILNNVQSFDIFEEVLDIIYHWLYLDFDCTIFNLDDTEVKDFIFKLSQLATPVNEKTMVTPSIFEKSIKILSYFDAKNDDFINYLPLRNILERLSIHFEKNIFPNSRALISQFVSNLLNVSTLNFDINDVFVLGDMFSLLPTIVDTPYFPSLINTASNLCKLSPEFAFNFIEHVDVQKIFSSLFDEEDNEQASDIHPIAKRSIIGLMIQFLQTGDQTLIDLAMPFFKWKIILSDMQEPPADINKETLKAFDENFEKIGWDAINLLGNFPQLANEPDSLNVIEYLLFFVNNKSFRNKQNVFLVISKLLSLQNADIANFLVEHDYIESALDLLDVDDVVSIAIIDSLHYIAQYAEVQSIPEIIDRMNDADIIDILIRHVDSENQKVVDSAVAFLNDQDLQYFHSLVPPPP